MGNGCQNFVENILAFYYLLKKQVKIYTAINLHTALYECKTWSLILREEHRLSEFEKSVLRISRPKREGVTGGWRKFHIRILIFSLHQILIGRSKKKD